MRHLALFAAVVALLALASGCDDSVSFYISAKFYAVNNTDVALHIYLNMEYQFSVEPGAEGSVKDLEEGDYTALARRQSDGAVVKEEDIYLEENEKFWWFIGETPTLGKAPLLQRPTSDAEALSDCRTTPAQPAR